MKTNDDSSRNNIVVENKNTFDIAIRKNFTEIRMSTERLMCREVCKGDKQDVTLSEVYDLIASDHGLTTGQANSLMRLEVEEEARNLLPL